MCSSHITNKILSTVGSTLRKQFQSQMPRRKGGHWEYGRENVPTGITDCLHVLRVDTYICGDNLEILKSVGTRILVKMGFQFLNSTLTLKAIWPTQDSWFLTYTSQVVVCFYHEIQYKLPADFLTMCETKVVLLQSNQTDVQVAICCNQKVLHLYLRAPSHLSINQNSCL